ncbi:MAG: hypothetical protein IJ458_03190 [Clostridia bacterium]|nr:hypothetical protein [Clostridia bacterium]
MDSKRLINLIEIKDKSVWVLIDYYIAKGANRVCVQKYVNDVCIDIAKSFIEQHQEAFNNRQTQLDVFRYISSIGADEPYSGNRFSEALYKELCTFVQNQEQLTITK